MPSRERLHEWFRFFLKVARGREWRSEIGMEHASWGRRCGNEGVGARLRGRFRIFSARHRSRTEAAPRGKFRNDDGFFLWRLLRCRACVDHGSGHSAPCRLRRDGTRGLVFRATCRLRRGRHEGVSFPGYVPPQERTARGRLVFVFLWRLLRCWRGILSQSKERRHEGVGAGEGAVSGDVSE